MFSETTGAVCPSHNKYTRLSTVTLFRPDSAGSPPPPPPPTRKPMPQLRPHSHRHPFSSGAHCRSIENAILLYCTQYTNTYTHTRWNTYVYTYNNLSGGSAEKRRRFVVPLLNTTAAAAVATVFAPRTRTHKHIHKHTHTHIFYIYIYIHTPRHPPPISSLLPVVPGRRSILLYSPRSRFRYMRERRLRISSLTDVSHCRPRISYDVNDIITSHTLTNHQKLLWPITVLPRSLPKRFEKSFIFPYAPFAHLHRGGYIIKHERVTRKKQR